MLLASCGLLFEARYNDYDFFLFILATSSTLDTVFTGSLFVTGMVVTTFEPSVDNDRLKMKDCMALTTIEPLEY